MGHTADIERLRMMVTDTASVEAFQNSVDDLTLHRLTNFVLGPTIKQAFEAIFGSAYIIKMLLAELGVRGGENQLLALNYDGTVRANHLVEVIGGTDEVESRDKILAQALKKLKLVRLWRKRLKNLKINNF